MDIEPQEQDIPFGIAPLDERTGGLERGGSYLIVGTPGPAKMVAAMQFLFRGVSEGEQVLYVTNVELEDFFDVAEAWGFDFRPFWRSGSLQVIGFREDFELRAIRSVDPEDVLEELRGLVDGGATRVAVDPGSLLLAGGAKSRLGAAYLRWARRSEATVCTTFSVDASASSLPSSADWMLQAATGRVVIEARADDLYEMSIVHAIPETGERLDVVTAELRPGEGLVRPAAFPARRKRDRAGIDENRLLLISLGPETGGEVEAWANGSFDTDLVGEAFEAVAKVQSDDRYGGILIHTARTRIREAITACRALRPLTRAAIVVGTDDAIRSRDRVDLLEAGADDCLSGGLDFRELDLRLRQAIAAGSRPPDEGATNESRDSAMAGGSVGPDQFVSEYTRRADDPILSFFCVVEAIPDEMDPADLVRMLLRQVRDEDGDLVTRVGDRCLVLLQGAREGQLSGFLARLRGRVGDATGMPADAAVRLEVLSHPSQSGRIRSLLGL
jgi:KaiC/GvpD/RAD55 family RecA-like ATPase/CheY-like chemotaxis protein